MRAAAFLLPVIIAAAAGCNTGPPQRDVFVPPYAEKGCWAQLYGEAQFAGATHQLEGPAYVETLAGSPMPQMRSLRIGPHARIVGYAQPLFREPALELPPGSVVTDLGELAFHERVQSFRMDCAA